MACSTPGRNYPHPLTPLCLGNSGGAQGRPPDKQTWPGPVRARTVTDIPVEDATTGRMAKTRACDACAVRKIKCDGSAPCSGCITTALECTRFKLHGKPGPKTPRHATRRAILEAQREYKRRRQTSQSYGVLGSQPAQPVDPAQFLQRQCFPATESTFAPSARPQVLPRDLGTAPPENGIPLSSIRVYLDIYHHKLHPLWPVVRRDEVIARLQDAQDLEIYALATAVCAATMVQLKLPMRRNSDAESLSVNASDMAKEAEQSRILMDYSDKASVDVLLSSWFLHVYYADLGRYQKSALLLRESVAIAHILGLHLKTIMRDLTGVQLNVTCEYSGCCLSLKGT